MRKTRSKSVQQRQDDVDDDSNDMAINATPSKKIISNEDEDTFITIILRHIDVVERKRTDQHLTPKVLREEQLLAWENIAKEFLDETSVSCSMFNSMVIFTVYIILLMYVCFIMF